MIASIREGESSMYAIMYLERVEAVKATGYVEVGNHRRLPWSED